MTTYCGRPFSAAELDRIRELAAAAPHREALAATVCAEFGWRKPDGGLKTMSLALLRMQRDGLVLLPAPLRPHSPSRHVHAPASPLGLPVRGSRADIAHLALAPVVSPAASQAWCCSGGSASAPPPGRRRPAITSSAGAPPSARPACT